MDTDFKLINYIREAKTTGMNDEHIAQLLVNSGWNMADMVGAFAAGNLVDFGATKLEGQAFDNSVVIKNISKHFNKVRALDDVSFTIPAGTVTALLGPNGAGKTTLVRILATLLKTDQGSASIAGHDNADEDHLVRSVIGLTGQFTALDLNLTGRENLMLVGQLYHLNSNYLTERVPQLLSNFELTDAADRPIKTYSGGMKRRLDLAASIIHNPRVLFLDEPTTGLDPHSRMQLWGVIKKLVSEGTTVLLTTQYLEEADHLSDSIVVLSKGSIIAHGTAEELKNQVGGEILELHVHDHATARIAAEKLESILSEKVHITPESGHLTISAGSRGVSLLVNSIKILTDVHIKIDDIALRRPTLDDVFLSLTGREIET